MNLSTGPPINFKVDLLITDFLKRKSSGKQLGSPPNPENAKKLEEKTRGIVWKSVDRIPNRIYGTERGYFGEGVISSHS